ncbi:MAG: AEC family transporter [Xanthobacteraceae bacterium]
MTAVLAALVPVFLVIALGAVLRHTLLPDRKSWDTIEDLTYFVLFPALLIVTTATADLREIPATGVGAALFLAIILLSFVLIAARPLLARAFKIDGPAFTSVFQGAVRWNTYVALAIAGSLHGALGLTLASVAIVAMVPLLNFLCVLVLAWYAADKAPDARSVAGQILRNPLIWSVLAGIAINLAGLPLPKIAISFAEILGRGALVLGLLAVGAGLDLDKFWRPRAAVIATVILKLAVMPAIAVGLGYWIGLSGAALTVVAIASSVPSAPGAYILARQMGGDAPLYAHILTMQTVAALVTIPVALAIAQSLAP